MLSLRKPLHTAVAGRFAGRRVSEGARRGGGALREQDDAGLPDGRRAAALWGFLQAGAGNSRPGIPVGDDFERNADQP